MSDLPSNPTPARKTGLSPKEQKIQAMRDKLAKTASGAKPVAGASSSNVKARNTFAGKKTAFQRKAT